MPFTCPICHRDDFVSERGVSCHIGKMHKDREDRRHGNERSWQKREDESKGRRQRTEDHRKNMSVFCPICNEKFSSERGVSIHVGKMHKNSEEERRDGKKRFDRTGNKDEQLGAISAEGPRQLVLDHRKKMSFPCPICNENFESERGVSIHIGKMHRDGDEERREGTKRFSSTGNKAQQPGVSKREDYKKKMTLSCPICHEDFSSERGVSIHMGKMHDGTSRNGWENSLNGASKFTDSLEDMPVYCHICNDRCKNERGLQIHIGRMHKDYPVEKYEDVEKYKQKSAGHSGSESGIFSLPSSTVSKSRLQDDINAIKLTKPDISAASSAVNYFIGEFKTKMEETSSISFDILKSGSYYDKTKNSMPDEFDFMFYPKKISVEPILEGASSGYCKLRIRSLPSELEYRVETNKCLDPARFKTFIFSIFDRILADKSFRPARKITRKIRPNESPAYTILYYAIPGKKPIDIDLVPSIQIEGWPGVARNVNPVWLKDNDLKSTCMKCFHVVTKTCPDNIRDADLMWRLSFSWAEKQLIKHANMGNEKSFRKSIFRCLKATLEKIKEDNPDRIKKFCSYHLKMFMLGQFDTDKYQTCESDEVNLTLLTINQLITLLRGIESGGCPTIQNYFIPSDNVLRAVTKQEIELVRKGFQKRIDYLQKGR